MASPSRADGQAKQPDVPSSSSATSATQGVNGLLLPRMGVSEGDSCRLNATPPDGFVARKTATIPAWASAVTLVANSIDGRPPIGDGVYSVKEFVRLADDLQCLPGAGEWDVLVYAVDDLNAGLELHPYGRDNPYRRLRKAPGHKIKQIARFSYMRWDWYDFSIER